MKKILSITAQKPHSTGSGTYLTEVVYSLDKMGYEQAVIAGIYPSDEAKFPQSVAFYPVFFEENFPIYGMSDAMPYPSSLYSKMTEADIERFTSMFKKVVEKAVSEFDPDIIFCHHLFLLAAIVRQMYPEKTIYGLCHGSDLRQIKTSKNLQNLILPWIPKLNRVYALHEEQAKTIADIYSMDVSDVYIAGSGYNTSIFHREGRYKRNEDDPMTILFAGKLSKAKGVPELFKACEILSKSEKARPFKLLLAGGCQDEDVKEQLDLILQKDFSGSKCLGVEYLGVLKQQALSDIMRKSDIFVLPSYFEGLGLVLIEAMACGMVPVSTDLPGVQDWITARIPGSNVIYVPQPEMETIDKPFDHALDGFVLDLSNAILEAFDSVSSGNTHPDTTNVSWDGVAQDIFGR